jgi:predicted small lipoprotein YifL
MTRTVPALAAALLLVSLAGCAEPGPYPSLGVRPAEAQYQAGDEERQPTPRADKAEVAAGIARFAAAARAGDAEFDRTIGAAQAAAARAGGPGSDSWAEAQQAVSRVEAARAKTTGAVADLDAFALEQAAGGTLSEADGERLRAAVAELQALSNAQAGRLDRLKASLGPR